MSKDTERWGRNIQKDYLLGVKNNIMANPIQGELDIQDTAGSVTRIKLNGDTAHISAGGEKRNGDVVLSDSTPKEKIHIGRTKLGKPPNERWVWAVNIMNSSGKSMAMLTEEGDLYLGGEGADGDIVVSDKDGKGRIRVGGDEQRILVWDKNSAERILLHAEKGIEVNQYSSLNRAGYFKIDNSDNGHAALEASTNGLGDGVTGRAVSDYKSGVYGVTTNENGYGVFGRIEAGYYKSYGALGALAGETTDVQEWNSYMPTGVYGRSDSEVGSGILGVGNSNGVIGLSFDYDGDGVNGSAYGDHGVGVVAFSGKYHALLATAPVYGGSELPTFPYHPVAGYFFGDVYTPFDLSVGGSKNFIIDHPIDPENKYLVHSSVESIERLNIYNGEVILDDKGEAWVKLPDWFEALNTKYQYQLTPIGGPAPNLHIAQEVSDNRFKIAGGRVNMKVSWQVTGVRQDAYAKAHPLQVEVEKRKIERGKYLHPIDHGEPEEMGIAYEKLSKLRKRHMSNLD
jgi:hypothetical protein